MIAVFAALEAEMRASAGWAPDANEREVEGYPVIEGPGFLVCQTGMGRRAEIAAAAILQQVEASVVVSTGIAGGLSPQLEIGEVVFCEHIDHESHRDPPRDETVYSDPRLVEAGLAAARGMGLPARTGSTITVDVVAGGPAEKAAHHAWKGHDIVEMESYWIGKAAAAAGVPFLAVRTVSDAAAHSLTATGSMRDDGTFDQDAFLDYIRANPDAAPTLAEQSTRARGAISNLTIFCAAFLPPLVQHFRAEVV